MSGAPAQAVTRAKIPSARQPGHPEGQRPAQAASSATFQPGHAKRPHPARAASPAAPPGTQLRHGYTLDSLTRLAHWAARRKRWAGGTDLPVRYEVAFAALAEHLYAATEPPAAGELIEAGWHAIAAHDEARRQFTGRGHGGTGPGRNFERYWRTVAAPADSPEEKVTDRIALAQIWPCLTRADREAFAALAVHGDYQRAADALGLSYGAFKCRISDGRRRFLALWHDGEAPSRPWVRDRRAGPGTDMHTVTYFLRDRRLRAAGASAETTLPP